MKGKNNFFTSSGFIGFKPPENILEELPTVSIKNNQFNATGQKFKIVRSLDKFWANGTRAQIPTKENSNLNKIKNFEPVRQFGEIQNDTEIKEDLKNLDRWVFDNIKKMRFFADEQRIPRNTLTIKSMLNADKDRFGLNLDLKFLDTILREEKMRLSKPFSDYNSRNAELADKTSILMQKVAVTAETVNSEYNKVILLELVKKKLRACERFNEKDEAFISNLSKMILTDLISSFKVLKIFKHHNIFHIKNLLMESKQAVSLNSTVIIDESNPNSKAQKELNFKAFEKALFDNFILCAKEIKGLKQRLNTLRDKINKRRQKINDKQQKLLKFAQEVERRENPVDSKRKISSDINPQDFIDLEEAKSQLSNMEAQQLKYNLRSQSIINQCQEETTRLEKFMQDLKFKKTLFYMKLKEIYYSLLSDEDSMIRQGKTVVNVVKLLWSIKAEVNEQLFSNFYEPNHITFLFKYTKLHNEFVELRKQNNIEKQVIKEQLIGVYQNIVDEKESARIYDVKKTIFCFKTANLRILQKQKIKEAKSVVFQWKNIDLNSIDPLQDSNFIQQSSNRSKRNAMHVGANSTKLTYVSENLCQLKENFIKNEVAKVAINGKVHFVGSNSVWLKKLFTVFFGKKEAQFLINELMKMKNIRIKEISL